MRKQGEGHYYREGKSYCWSMRVGVRRVVRKAQSPGELKEKVLRLQREIAVGKVAHSKPLSVGAFLERFMETGEWQIKTREEYVRAVRYLKVEAATQQLDKLTPSRVEEIGRLISAKHGSGSAKKAHAVLRAALTIALRDQLVAINVAAVARSPKHAPKPKRYLVRGDAGQFVRSLPASRYGYLMRFLINSGMRIGEALRVSPFDITAEGVRIWKAKTNAGEGRLVPLNTEARRAVADMMALRSEDASQQPWIDHGVLFSSSTGTPLSYRNTYRELQKMLAAAGLGPLGLHDLRRTFATQLARARIDDVDFAAVMGWSNVSAVREIYVMVDGEQKNAAVEQIRFE